MEKIRKRDAAKARVTITEKNLNMVMREINKVLPMSRRDILNGRKIFFYGKTPLSPKQVVRMLDEYGNKSHRNVFHPFTEEELEESFPALEKVA
jgi:hypothetical protein